jgi:carbon storage regulator
VLVLGRKQGQRVVIGEGPGRVTITVAQLSSGKVRLAIDAPRDVPVFRDELLPPVVAPAVEMPALDQAAAAAAILRAQAQLVEGRDHE